MLVERDDDLADLLRQADEARSGTGRLVLLSGEAGIGKTALVARLAEDVSTHMATRRGCADDLTTASPLGVVVEALPELRSPADADGSERLQLLRRVRELLARTPTLLLLEDVHWADEATLDVLRYLGRRLADLPLLAVVTYRPEDVSVRHRLSLVLGDLGGRPGVTRRTLAPLSAAAVAALTVATGS
ncbi:MAG: AAA family ATPase, partial [Actinobacteria bacterium]|nr:AAA family ATPase [Actinomycetota bacterium]